MVADDDRTEDGDGDPGRRLLLGIQDLIGKTTGVVSSRVSYTGGDVEETIRDIDRSRIWPGKVVTTVTPAGPYLEAEPEHQDYLLRRPHGYTCHFVRPNWRLPGTAEMPA